MSTVYQVYCATQDSGVFYSSDFTPDGDMPTWTAVNSGLPSTDVLQFDIAHMYPYRTEYQFLLLASQLNVYRRYNGGLWTSILSNIQARALTGTAGGNIEWVCADRTLPGYVYVLFYYGIVDATSGIYLLISDDWGDNWTVTTVVDVGDYGFIHNCGNVVADNGHIWVGGNADAAGGAGRVFYSANGGSSWAWTATLGSSDWSPYVFPVPGNPTTCYAYDFNAFKFGMVKVESDLSFAYVRGAGLNDGPIRPDSLWISPYNSQHQRQRYGDNLYYTSDAWSTQTDPGADFTHTTGVFAPPGDDLNIITGRTSLFPASTIAALEEGGTTYLERGGPMYNSAPYTDSIPKPSVSGDVSMWGIQFVSGYDDEPDNSCYVADVTSTGIAARYYVLLRDHAGGVVAHFDSWTVLEFQKKVNESYSYSITFADNGDARYLLFGVDYQVQVYRSVPAAGVEWYLAYEGFHRTSTWRTDSNGAKTFTSTGVGYNDLLARTIIAYDAGTVRSDKDDEAETVMKEYVVENCGTLATLGGVVGRLSYGVLPGFTVEADGGAGPRWTGSRAYENLLMTLQDIARFSLIDFEVVGTGPGTFEFKTYIGQLGLDRTYPTVNPRTGLNAAGNTPLKFSIPTGNVQDMGFEINRSSEVNVIVVLGKGEYSTRHTSTVRDEDEIDDSPWNRREISRSGSSQDYDYQREDLGEEVLQEAHFTEEFSFTPLQQASCLFGKHYDFGDRITLAYGSFERDQRLIGVTIRVADGKETITHEFADIA